jgi:hypothetical protein
MLVFVEVMWRKADKAMRREEVGKLRAFCKGLTFYNAVNIALSAALVDLSLYDRIDAVRRERNDVVHQLWTYMHRRNSAVLRKKLEKLARLASELVGIVNRVTSETGVDEVYEIFL